MSDFFDEDFDQEEPTECRACKTDFGDPGELNIYQLCGYCWGQRKAYDEVLNLMYVVEPVTFAKLEEAINKRLEKLC